MPQTFQYQVQSNPANHFTEALAQNVASAMYNLPGVPPIGSRWFLIRAMCVLTNENWNPEVNLFSSKNGLTVNPATDAFLARFAFTSAMGEQLSGSGLWRYYNDGMGIPYYDFDSSGTTTPPTLHVVMQNVGATAKSAYPTDSTLLTVWLETMSV